MVKPLTAEDFVANDHADMDAFAVDYIAVQDRCPIEWPHGKGCACWAAIARQIARAAAISPSPSARALQDDVYSRWPFAYGRDGPFQIPGDQSSVHFRVE